MGFMTQPMSTKRLSQHRGRWGLRWLLLGALATSGTMPAMPAWAGPGDRIAAMNKKAMESYDALDFPHSKKTLEECVAFLRKSGMENTIQAARTFINLGMVFVQLKDSARGEQLFRKALGINPNAKLDPALATPDIQTVWDQANGLKPATPAPVVVQQPVTPPPAPTPKPEPVTQPDPGQRQPDPELPDPGQKPEPVKPNPGTSSEYNPDELLNPVKKVELRHTPYEEVPANQKFSIYVKPVPVHPAGVVAKATLFFRVAGQAKYSESPMVPSRKQQGDLQGLIPEYATNGRALQYYIEGYDNLGRLCGNFGNAENPTILKISVSRGVVAVPAEDVEDPLLYVKREDDRVRLASLRDHVYIDIGVGTGGALVGAGATTEVAWFYNRPKLRYEQANASNGGFVWAGVGLRAEIGAYLYRGLSLGLSGRFEAFLNHNADSQENGSISPNCTSNGIPSPCFGTTSKGKFGYAVLGKLRYQFLPGSVVRPYLHLDAGVGEWRGALNIDGSRPMANGAVDNSSPFQPTDICSATYNGKTGGAADPATCSAISGNVGFNQRDAAAAGTAASNLNRVCPVVGPCIDSIAMNKIMVGGGAGLYIGGRHAGLSMDLNVIAALGGQFGLLVDAYVGPQFIF